MIDSGLTEQLFRKTIDKGKEINVTLPYTAFFSSEPERNILLLSRGYFYSDDVEDGNDGSFKVGGQVAHKDLRHLKMAGEELDEVKYLIYFPKAVEVKEFIPADIRKRRGAPKIEHQELLDAGWKQIGPSIDGFVLVRTKPHAVEFPKEITEKPELKNLISELED